MFFLFRCAIFLGIVFYYLPWPDGAVSSLFSNGAAHHASGKAGDGKSGDGKSGDTKALDVKAAVASAAGEIGQAAARIAARKVEEACRENSDRCAAYAAHLAQMIRQDSTPSAASLAKYPLGPALGESHETQGKSQAASFEHWELRLRD